MQFASLIMLLKHLGCLLCLKSNVLEAFLVEKERYGFSAIIKVKYTDCGQETLSMFLCWRVGSATSSRALSAINLQTVFAFQGIG